MSNVTGPPFWLPIGQITARIFRHVRKLNVAAVSRFSNPRQSGQTKMLHGKGLENAKKVELLAAELLNHFAGFMLREHALKFLAENVA
jgi:hypothetical protein